MSATKHGETHTETWNLSPLSGAATVIAQCNGSGFLLQKREYARGLHGALAQGLAQQLEPTLISINLSREEAEALTEVLAKFLHPSPEARP